MVNDERATIELVDRHACDLRGCTVNFDEHLNRKDNQMRSDDFRWERGVEGRGRKDGRERKNTGEYGQTGDRELRLNSIEAKFSRIDSRS